MVEQFRSKYADSNMTNQRVPNINSQEISFYGAPDTTQRSFISNVKQEEKKSPVPPLPLSSILKSNNPE